MANVNLAISIITLYINGLNTQIKMAEFIRLDKKGFNYKLYTRHTT